MKIIFTLCNCANEKLLEVISERSYTHALGFDKIVLFDMSKDTDNDNIDKITIKEVKLISSTISDLSDEDGWAYLGDVGGLLQKRQPNFDSRNYGFEKLTSLIQSTGKFEVEKREIPKSRHKLIYVKNKEKIVVKTPQNKPQQNRVKKK